MNVFELEGNLWKVQNALLLEGSSQRDCTFSKRTRCFSGLQECGYRQSNQTQVMMATMVIIGYILWVIAEGNRNHCALKVMLSLISSKRVLGGIFYPWRLTCQPALQLAFPCDWWRLLSVYTTWQKQLGAHTVQESKEKHEYHMTILWVCLKGMFLAHYFYLYIDNQPSHLYEW